MDILAAVLQLLCILQSAQLFGVLLVLVDFSYCDNDLSHHITFASHMIHAMTFCFWLISSYVSLLPNYPPSSPPSLF